MIVWLEYSLSIEGRYGYETSGELFVGWYKFKQGPNALEIPKPCKLWFETLKIWAKIKKKVRYDIMLGPFSIKQLVASMTQCK